MPSSAIEALNYNQFSKINEASDKTKQYKGLRTFTNLSFAACSKAISIESQEPQYDFYGDEHLKGLVGKTTEGVWVAR